MDEIAKDYPKPISEVFAGLPDNVDAALYIRFRRVGKTYFFKVSDPIFFLFVVVLKTYTIV